MSLSSPVITLHWLEASRSQRIAWLLEELGVDYKLKLYGRDPVTHRADKELSKVFPLGKSPVIEVDYQDGKPAKVIAESGHIVSYLIRHFDTDKKMTAVSEEGIENEEFLLHFSEASIQPYLTWTLILDVAKGFAPFLFRGVIGMFCASVRDKMSIVELNKAFGYLESMLAKTKPADGELFFVDDKLTGADIMLHFNVHLAYISTRLPGFDGSKYPNLSKWLEQVEKRPAFLQAAKRIETEGRGKFKL